MVNKKYSELSEAERRKTTQAEVERAMTLAGIDRDELAKALAIKSDTIRKFQNGYTAASPHLLALIREIPERMASVGGELEASYAVKSPVIEQAELVLQSGTIEEARILTQIIQFLHAGLAARAERTEMLTKKRADSPDRRRGK